MPMQRLLRLFQPRILTSIYPVITSAARAGSRLHTLRRSRQKEEKRQIELDTLDRKYADKLSNLELEMAKAKAIEDEDLYTELKEERESLINEYSEKRGEI